MSRTDPSVRLTEEIARQLDQLGDRLSALPAREAAQVLARVLEPDEGVLSRVTALMAAGSHFVKDHAERGALPPEVWLALGRAANELHDIVLDLDEHTDTLRTLHTPPAPAAAPVQTAAPLVVRRHR